MSSKHNHFDVTEVTDGKLPPRVLELIDKIEVSIEEVREMERSKAPIYIRIMGEYVKYRFEGQFSLRKGLVILGSSISTVAILVKYWGELHQIFGSLVH